MGTYITGSMLERLSNWSAHRDRKPNIPQYSLYALDTKTLGAGEYQAVIALCYDKHQGKAYGGSMKLRAVANASLNTLVMVQAVQRVFHFHEHYQEQHVVPQQAAQGCLLVAERSQHQELSVHCTARLALLFASDDSKLLLLRAISVPCTLSMNSLGGLGVIFLPTVACGCR